MRSKKFLFFFLLNALLINYGLMIQPAYSSIQDLPFSDSTTLLFNNSYEKSVSFTPSSNPFEERTGIIITVILYNGSVYLKLTENTTNSTITSLFLNFSLPINWKEYIFEIDFGIYTVKFLNNESLNATFSFAVLSDARWIDPVFYGILPLITICLIVYL